MVPFFYIPQTRKYFVVLEIRLVESFTIYTYIKLKKKKSGYCLLLGCVVIERGHEGLLGYLINSLFLHLGVDCTDIFSL